MWRQDQSGWTQADELAASQIEMTDLWGRVLAIVFGAKPNSLPAPPSIKHPGRQAAAPTKREVTTDPAEIRAFFAAHMRR